MKIIRVITPCMSTIVSLYVDDFELAMNSINWIIDTQITARLLRPFTRPGWQNGSPMLQCELKKTSMTRDQAYLVFAFNTGKKCVCQVRTINTIFTLENWCCREAARGSLTSECNSPLLLGAQTANIQFALVSFSWQKRHHTLYRCNTPMPTSPNDTESIYGMVSDYWNINFIAKIIYRRMYPRILTE